MLDMHMHRVHKKRMRLSAYLDQTKETDAAFAKRAKLSQSQISRLRRGVSMPSWQAMSAIAAATKDAVTVNDWIPEKRAQKRKREPQTASAA